jgi:ribose transport system substrate-binding protein
MATALAACGDDDSSPSNGSGAADGNKETQAKIAFFGLAAANPYTQWMYKGAEVEAKKLGATIEFYDGKFDPKAQYGQVQDAITSGKFNVFIIMPNDSASIVPVVKQAINEGIKVGALQFPIGPKVSQAAPQVPGVSTSVIEDLVMGGRVVAEGIVTACKGIDPCKVAHIWGAREVPFEAAKADTFLGILEKHPNIDLVFQGDGGFLQGPGEKIAAQALQREPDVDVISSFGDDMMIGVERAIQKAGRTIGLGEGDLKLVGYGASKYSVKQVREGRWVQTYLLAPVTMAKAIVTRMVDAHNGKPVPEGSVQTDLAEIPAKITKEFLDKTPSFTGEWEG